MSEKSETNLSQRACYKEIKLKLKVKAVENQLS